VPVLLKGVRERHWFEEETSKVGVVKMDNQYTLSKIEAFYIYFAHVISLISNELTIFSV
jgi:hypothetical protein